MRDVLVGFRVRSQEQDFRHIQGLGKRSCSATTLSVNRQGEPRDYETHQSGKNVESNSMEEVPKVVHVSRGHGLMMILAYDATSPLHDWQLPR